MDTIIKTDNIFLNSYSDHVTRIILPHVRDQMKFRSQQPESLDQRSQNKSFPIYNAARQSSTSNKLHNHITRRDISGSNSYNISKQPIVVPDWVSNLENKKSSQVKIQTIKDSKMIQAQMVAGTNKISPANDIIKEKNISDGKTGGDFWFEEPLVLFQTLDIIPNENMSDGERLNAMTRVIILISAIMFAIKFPAWWIFLTLGITVVIIMWYIIKDREQTYINNILRREYLRRPKRSIIYPIKDSNLSGRKRIIELIPPGRIKDSIGVNNNIYGSKMDKFGGQMLNIISIP